MGTLDDLFSQIDSFLADAARRDLADIERTLTDGYAHALSIEAERWRLEKRLSQVAGSLGSGDAGEKTKELSALAKRLEASDGDLTRLRARLADLRRVAESVRV